MVKILSSNPQGQQSTDPTDQLAAVRADNELMRGARDAARRQLLLGEVAAGAIVHRGNPNAQLPSPQPNTPENPLQ